MELRVGDRQRGDVKGLQMRVGVSVDLWVLRFWECVRARAKRLQSKDVLLKKKYEKKPQIRTLNKRIRRSELATSNMDSC